MNVKILVAFVVGVGLGSAITYISVKRQFEDAMNDEIDEAKEYYQKKMEQKLNKAPEKVNDVMDEPEEINDEDDQPVNEVDYTEIIQKLNYGAYSKKEATEKEESGELKKASILVISGDDFAGDEKYIHATLHYFESDGVVMDAETEEVIADGINLFGDDNLDKFGEYEEDILFVANHDTKTCYEVIHEHEAYAESEYYYKEYGVE